MSNSNGNDQGHCVVGLPIIGDAQPAITALDERVGWLLALANCRLPCKIMGVANREIHIYNSDNTWTIAKILDWDSVNYKWVSITNSPESVLTYHHD